MASYQVGDTQYQFPDSFTEDQVHGILMKQGVIRPDAAKPPLPEGMRPGADTRTFMESFGHGINPINSVPAMFNGIADTVTGKNLERGIRRPDLTRNSAPITPGEWGDTAAGAANTAALGVAGRSLSAGPAARFASRAGGNFPSAAEVLPYPLGGLAKFTNRLFAGEPAQSSIASPSVTGGYQRPDYSNLIQMPGHGVPPYEPPVSASSPQPRPQTDFGAHIPNYGDLVESPAIAPPPVETSPEAEVPHPRMYVSTSGAPEAPWNTPRRPQSGTVGGTVAQGKSQPYVGPTSFNAAPKVTPGTIPELMRQQRLQATAKAGDVAPPPVILDASGKPIIRGGTQ